MAGVRTSHRDAPVANLYDQRCGRDRRADQQARFELALDASGVGMWDWDLRQPVLTWDERTRAMFGVPPQATVTYDDFLALLDPADRDNTRRLVAAALDPRGSGEYESEYRLFMAAGERKIIAARGRVLFGDESGERQPIRFVGTVLDITERQMADRERERALEALRDSEQRYALAARATESAIWDWDLETDGLVWSEGIERVFGYTMAEVPRHITWWYEHIHPDDRRRVIHGVRDLIDGPLPDSVRALAGAVDINAAAWYDTYRFRRADGQYTTVVDRRSLARDAAGRPTRMIGAMEAETDREHLEERLRQAQKMQAVGQLTSAIAHDFNNLLTVIAGNLEFARVDLGPDHPARIDLEEIGKATERARALVRQLLAFSRKQALKLAPINLSSVVRNAETLLRRLIGEEIVLDVTLDAQLPAILADSGQLEQVLMNLVVNARDAMLSTANDYAGRGGRVIIETATASVSAEDSATRDGLAPGVAVLLRVQDFGHGMDDATKARAFEPFFTTKAVGAGTGLGLATVFGIVRQFGGTVRVESTEGQGTTFTMLFPSTPTSDAPAIPLPPTLPLERANGTVLLVEDEDAVRLATRRMLERQGYVVLEARHGAEALALWHTHRSTIDAVVTDLRMPEMSGIQLVATLRQEQPQLPVVYMSGYSDETLDDVHNAMTTFVEKPFTIDTLVSSVQQVLLSRRARA